MFLLFSAIPYVSVWHPFMTAKLMLKVPYISLKSGAHALKAYPYLTLTYSANISPVLNQPRAKDQATGDHLSSHSPPTLFKPANQLFLLPYLPFPLETPMKALGQAFPSLHFCCLTKPVFSPGDPVWCGPAWCGILSGAISNKFF